MRPAQNSLKFVRSRPPCSADDFPDGRGETGNAFMELMEVAAARAPWMGSVGNHEAANGFSQWAHRFGYYKKLAERSGSDSAFHYSYNHGLVHFVHISTEHTPATAWLDADLSAVDRAVTPWVVAVGACNLRAVCWCHVSS